MLARAAVAAGADGLFYGNSGQLWIQFVSVVATCVFAFVVTWIILVVIKAVMGLRVGEDQEEAGLDLSQHSETGYQP